MPVQYENIFICFKFLFFAHNLIAFSFLAAKGNTCGNNKNCELWVHCFISAFCWLLAERRKVFLCFCFWIYQNNCIGRGTYYVLVLNFSLIKWNIVDACGISKGLSTQRHLIKNVSLFWFAKIFIFLQ